jgi:hypothetical protein
MANEGFHGNSPFVEGKSEQNQFRSSRRHGDVGLRANRPPGESSNPATPAIKLIGSTGASFYFAGGQ